MKTKITHLALFAVLVNQATAADETLASSESAVGTITVNTPDSYTIGVGSTATRTLTNAIVLDGGNLKGGVMDNVATVSGLSGDGRSSTSVDANGVSITLSGSGLTDTTADLTLASGVTVTGANQFLVGGGAGGGGNRNSRTDGGGGGGGFVVLTTGNLSDTLTLTAGGGSAGSLNSAGATASGGSSAIGFTTAAGGTGASSASISRPIGQGGNSGQSINGTVAAFTGGSGPGGTGNGAGGGGAGSSANGSDNSGTTAGAGGAGTQITTGVVDIATYLGSATFGGGGGGGYQDDVSSGGTGGGGNGAAAGVAGTDGLGGGGGGAGRTNGGNGGAGSVAIQYAYDSNVAAGALTLSGGITLNSTSTLDVRSGGQIDVTTNAITGAGGLVKDGLGTLTLSTVNTYNGGTTLNAGKLTIADNDALGTGTLTLNGGTLSAAAGSDYDLSENIVVNGTAAVITESNTNTTELQLTGDITGSGTLNFGGTGSGQGNRAVQVRDNLDGFDGTINYESVDGGNTVLFYGVNTTAALELSGNMGGSGYLGLQTGNVTFGELSGTGGKIVSWNRTLTINQDTDTTYAGTMADAGSTQKLSFTKAGSGTLTLTGTNTYKGTTVVNNGTLIIDGDQSSATGAMTINGSGTLAGSGMIGASLLTVNGVIAPGNSPGTLATNSQLWNDGASYLWEIDDATGTQGADTGWDLLDITGTLDLTGLTAGGFTIDIDSLLHVDHTSGDALNFVPETDYSFVIVSATSISGFDASLFNLDDSGFTNEGWLWSISADANKIYLGAAAVPEPATYALLGGLLALGHVMVRRRR